MADLDATIWMHAAGEACGHCRPTPSGAVCRGADGDAACERPLLAGDVAAASRLLEALREVAFAPAGTDLVGAGQVRRLQVDDGQAELTLAFPRGCGAHALAAEHAFQVLRRLLPDTDVFVHHAG